MNIKAKKGFYIFFGFMIAIIIAENIWFGNGELIRYNLLALFTISLVIVLDGSTLSSKKDGVAFYITIGVILVVYSILLFIIGNYFERLNIL